MLQASLADLFTAEATAGSRSTTAQHFRQLRHFCAAITAAGPCRTTANRLGATQHGQTPKSLAGEVHSALNGVGGLAPTEVVGSRFALSHGGRCHAW